MNSNEQLGLIVVAIFFVVCILAVASFSYNKGKYGTFFDPTYEAEYLKYTQNLEYNSAKQSIRQSPDYNQKSIEPKCVSDSSDDYIPFPFNLPFDNQYNLKQPYGGEKYG